MAKYEGLHFVYLLQCADGSIYCGYSTDPVKRTQTHNKGRGAKYTRARLPVLLSYCEMFQSKSEALKRECELKKLSRGEKLKLISTSK